MQLKYRWEVINYLINKYEYDKFLEIGYGDGLNFGKINCNEKKTVDPNLSKKDTESCKYKMTSDAFFKEAIKNKETFDIIFIDGLHHSDQVDRDIEHSLKTLSDGGVVVLHDCNPPNELAQRVPIQSGEWTGDVWRSVIKFRRENFEFGMVVLDTDYGVGVISKDIPQTSVPDFKKLTYDVLDENRLSLLHLISPEDLHLHLR